MPDLDGFGVIENVEPSVSPAPVYVFVTAHDAHAIRAFEVHAVDYLLKQQSISDWKNVYATPCQECVVRSKCGGFFHWNIPIQSRGIHPFLQAPETALSISDEACWRRYAHARRCQVSGPGPAVFCGPMKSGKIKPLFRSSVRGIITY
jgi:CheY-like chemotaxis protein